MKSETGSLLVVDDEEPNRDMLSRRLKRKGFDVITACDGPEALELIETQTFDLVLLDLMMPGMNGLAVLDHVRRGRSVAELPIIMVTAHHEAATVVEALEGGANDYITKPIDFPVLFARVATQIARARAERSLIEANESLDRRVKERTTDLEIVVRELEREIAERKNAEEQSRLLLESTAEAIFGVDLDGRCTFANPSCARLLGRDGLDGLVGGKVIDGCLPADPGTGESNDHAARLLRAISDGADEHLCDVTLARADGGLRAIECWTRPIHRDGRLTGAVITLLDITERKRVDERLRQSQKLEAVGQLAGGIAHEFNNLLMIIGGYIRKAVESAESSEAVTECLNEAQKAAARAGTLTKQLLVFSRKRVLEREIVNVGRMLGDVETLLRPLLDQRFELRIENSGDSEFIEVDSDQLTQALVNLVINARDAMPAGGKIVMGCRATAVEAADAASSAVDLPPGGLVALSVRDEGIGMDERTKDRIFEPFFTTKGPESGTGLGLAMVHGFVDQSGGFIDIQSAVGEGTEITLSFPQAEPQVPTGVEDGEDVPGGRGEVVLVVEDEAALRRLLCDDLERLGYKVLSASDGPQALEIEEDHDGPIHLLLSDMVMPGFGGGAIAKAIRLTRPDIAVVLISGYPMHGQDHDTEIPDGIPFLSKPVDRATLARTIRDELETRQTLTPQRPGSDTHPNLVD